MRETRTVILVLLALVALAGAGLIVLASTGDASVVASTGSIYTALEAAGAQDNLSLRTDLYTAVLRLKEPWAAVQLAGLLVLFLALVAMAAIWRRLR